MSTATATPLRVERVIDQHSDAIRRACAAEGIGPADTHATSGALCGFVALAVARVLERFTGDGHIGLPLRVSHLDRVVAALRDEAAMVQLVRQVCRSVGAARDAYRNAHPDEFTDASWAEYRRGPLRDHEASAFLRAAGTDADSMMQRKVEMAMAVIPSDAAEAVPPAPASYHASTWLLRNIACGPSARGLVRWGDTTDAAGFDHACEREWVDEETPFRREDGSCDFYVQVPSRGATSSDSGGGASSGSGAGAGEASDVVGLDRLVDAAPPSPVSVAAVIEKNGIDAKPTEVFAGAGASTDAIGAYAIACPGPVVANADHGTHWVVYAVAVDDGDKDTVAAVLATGRPWSYVVVRFDPHHAGGGGTDAAGALSPQDEAVVAAAQEASQAAAKLCEERGPVSTPKGKTKDADEGDTRPRHPGSWDYHDDDCLCAAYGGGFCNRNGHCWSCCGSTVAGPTGCTAAAGTNNKTAHPSTVGGTLAFSRGSGGARFLHPDERK